MGRADKTPAEAAYDPWCQYPPRADEAGDDARASRGAYRVEHTNDPEDRGGQCKHSRDHRDPAPESAQVRLEPIAPK
jgi:hypothetical protein